MIMDQEKRATKAGEQEGMEGKEMSEMDGKREARRKRGREFVQSREGKLCWLGKDGWIEGSGRGKRKELGIRLRSEITNVKRGGCLKVWEEG